MARSDDSLFRDVLAGNLQAFTELVSRYERPLFQYFFRHTRNVHDAENLVQETFTRVYAYRHSYDTNLKLRTWIFTVATNRYRDFLRARKRLEKTREAAGIAAVFASLPEDSDPQAAALGRELRRIVMQALEELPIHHRSVLLLKHFHGLRYDEIARVQRCSVGTVKSRMHHAVKKLRNKLDLRGFLPASAGAGAGAPVEEASKRTDDGDTGGS